MCCITPLFLNGVLDKMPNHRLLFFLLGGLHCTSTKPSSSVQSANVTPSTTKLKQKTETRSPVFQGKVTPSQQVYWENLLNKVSLEEIASVNDDLLNIRGQLAYKDVFSCLNDMSSDPELSITEMDENNFEQGPLHIFGIQQYRANTELNIAVSSSREKPHVFLFRWSIRGALGCSPSRGESLSSSIVFG